MSKSALNTPQRGFSHKEFQQRCECLQQRMQQRNIECVLLTTEAELYYFTGFFTQFWQSPTRPWFVLIPAEGKPIAIIPSIGENLMQDCYIGNLYTWSSPNDDDDGISLLLQQLRYQAPSASLGTMMGNETHLRAPLNTLLAIQQRFPSLRDVTSDIHAIRQIKSAAEIEKIQHICQLTSQTFAELPSLCHKDMPLIEVFTHFKIQALKQGVDSVNYLVGAADQHGYNDIIAPPTQKALQSGDMLMLDTGCVWDGYFSDFNRNFAIGSAGDATHQAYTTLYEATEQALSIARPGTTMQALFHIMNRVVNHESSELKSQSVGRYGHGLGIQLTETPSIIDWDETPLKPGMVITLEPAIQYTDSKTHTNKLMVTEENILITEHDPVLLSQRATATLPIINL